MSEFFADRVGCDLIAELASAFKNKDLYRSADVPVIFVCGGKTDVQSTMRAQFLWWAHQNLSDHVVLLAENAFRTTLVEHHQSIVNLATFESLIAGVSDCVLIFPESAGSLAEVGYFANSKASKKILIANHLKFQAEDSFINLGPLQTINSRSFLQPSLHLSMQGDKFDFSPVADRLRRIKERSRRRQIRYRSYKELQPNERFFIVLEALRVVRITTLENLYKLLKQTHQGANKRDLVHFLSIMIAANYARRNGEFFIADWLKPSMVEFDDFHAQEHSAKILQYYSKRQRHLYERIVSNADAC